MVDLFGNEDEVEESSVDVIGLDLVQRRLHPISNKTPVRLHDDAEATLRPLRGPTCGTCDFLSRNGRNCLYPFEPNGAVAEGWPACDRWMLDYRLPR